MDFTYTLLMRLNEIPSPQRKNYIQITDENMYKLLTGIHGKYVQINDTPYGASQRGQTTAT